MHAWLTPNIETIAEVTLARTICVPASLLSYVGGALELLAEGFNWEEHGTATPEEMATFFREVRDMWGMSGFAEVGKIQGFMRATLPDKWLPITGQWFLQSDYPELAEVLPSSWKVGSLIRPPNMVLRGLIGSGESFGTQYDIGDIGGEDYGALETSNIPPHYHTVDRYADVPMQAGVGALALAEPALPDVTGTTGDADAFTVMNPLLVVNWGIYAGR